MVTKKEHSSGEHSKDDVVEIPVGKWLGRVRANPWIPVSFILAILLIISLAVGGFSGRASEEKVGENVISFLKANPDIASEVSLVSTARDGDFYVVTLNYQGQNVPVYTTLDGEYLIGNPVKLTTEDTETDTPPTNPPATGVVKSDKPVVELFVMSHCPFGTQIEKGILPVVEALGDSIDFEVKFVNYAMHGEKEVTEQVQQYCIQEEQNAKYLDYLQCFLESGESEPCLTQAGVNKAQLASCVSKADKEFDITKNLEDRSSWSNGQFPKFMIHDEDNVRYGVRGSPTLVINGAQVSSSRDSASLLRTICSAFNEAPEACNAQLDSAQPSPGFGFQALAAGSNTAAAGCVV